VTGSLAQAQQRLQSLHYTEALFVSPAHRGDQLGVVAARTASYTARSRSSSTTLSVASVRGAARAPRRPCAAHDKGTDALAQVRGRAGHAVSHSTGELGVELAPAAEQTAVGKVHEAPQFVSRFSTGVPVMAMRNSAESA